VTNNFLNFIVIAVLVGTFVSAPVPEPASRSWVSRATTSDPVVDSRAPAVPEAEAQAPDDLELRAAQAAIEADGYKRVRVLGKATDGTWRAKAYKGTSEVQLIVDGMGRVSAE
jgi:hypothetical protein